MWVRNNSLQLWLPVFPISASPGRLLAGRLTRMVFTWQPRPEPLTLLPPARRTHRKRQKPRFMFLERWVWKIFTILKLGRAILLVKLTPHGAAPVRAAQFISISI